MVKATIRKRKERSSCAKCSIHACYPDMEVNNLLNIQRAPEFCPMKVFPDIMVEAAKEYEKVHNKDFCRLSSVQEFECYEHTPDGLRTRNTRVEEIIQLCKKCGFKRLGIAFCGGLDNEARIFANVLENSGFDVVSVRCKVGGVEKEKIGIRPSEKIFGKEKWETACNPIAQAMILNAEKATWNYVGVVRWA